MSVGSRTSPEPSSGARATPDATREQTTAPRAPWPAPLATAATLAVVGDRARSLFDAARPLGRFPDRAIGESTLAGVDASGYAGAYVSTLLVAGVVLLALLVLFTWVERRLAPRGRRLPEPRLEAAFELALFAAFAHALSIVGRGRWHTEALGTFLLVLAIAAVAWAAIGRALERDEVRLPARLAVWLRDVDGAARQPGTLAVALLLPACLFVPASLALGGDLIVPVGSPLAGTLTLIGVAGAILVAIAAGNRRAGASARAHAFDAGHRFQVVALPLLATPMAVVASNELQYSWGGLSARAYALVASALLAAGAAVGIWATHDARFRRLAARVPPLGSPRVLRRAVVFPLAVANASVLVFHRHFLDIGELDYFHLGERTLPAQQLFHFGKIPLLDLRLTHTLSDLVFPGLYGLLNGVRGLDPLIWERWLALVLATLLIYSFLARLAAPRLALLLTAATPALSLVSFYYAPLLLAPLVWGWTARRPTSARYALLWIALAATAAWRIDFGIASAAGLAVALAVDLWGRPWARWRAPVLSAAVLGALFVAAALVSSWVAGRSVPGALMALVESYSQRLITRTRPQIIGSYTSLAALQYFLLPAVGLASVVRLAWIRFGRRRHLAGRDRLLGALAAVCLVLSVRSTERHTLIEAFNPYVFFFLIVVLPLWHSRRLGRALAASAALTLLLLRLVLALPPLGYELGFFERSHLLPDRQLYELRTWRGDEQRVRFPEDRHRDLVAFLRERLAPSQTFFDLTSSPLLYVLADREFPTYLIPNLSQTAERVQERVLADLEPLRERGDLPYVLLHQNSYWDTMDGVATEVRSYRIAEWIYRHYRPLGLLGTWEIWGERGGAAGTLGEREADVPIATWTLPLREPSARHATDVEPTSSGSLRLLAREGDPYIDGFVDLSSAPPLEPPADWRLELEIRGEASGYLQLFYAFAGEPYGDRRAPFLALGARHGGSLAVDLPSSGQPLASLRLDPPENTSLEIVSVQLAQLPVRPKPLPNGRVEQRFELRSLPRVWAELDPLRALERTEVISVLTDRPLPLDPQRGLRFEVDDSAIARAAYLRLLVRRPAAPVAGAAEIELLLDGDACCGVTFEARARQDRTEISDHLIRLATLYRWHVGKVTALELHADRPLEIVRAELRGDDPSR